MGRKCKILITIQEPSHWIDVRTPQHTIPSVNLNKEPNPKSKSSGVPGRPSPSMMDENDEAWWSNDVTVLLTGPSKLFADITCKNPPHCRKLEAAFTVWDAGEYR